MAIDIVTFKIPGTPQAKAPHGGIDVKGHEGVTSPTFVVGETGTFHVCVHSFSPGLEKYDLWAEAGGIDGSWFVMRGSLPGNLYDAHRDLTLGFHNLPVGLACRVRTKVMWGDRDGHGWFRATLGTDTYPVTQAEIPRVKVTNAEVRAADGTIELLP